MKTKGKSKASLLSASKERFGPDQWFPNHSPHKVSREEGIAWLKIKV